MNFTGSKAKMRVFVAIEHYGKEFQLPWVVEKTVLRMNGGGDKTDFYATGEEALAEACRCLKETVKREKNIEVEP
jgi:hypothetical protein